MCKITETTNLTRNASSEEILFNIRGELSTTHCSNCKHFLNFKCHTDPQKRNATELVWLNFFYSELTLVSYSVLNISTNEMHSVSPNTNYVQVCNCDKISLTLTNRLITAN